MVDVIYVPHVTNYSDRGYVVEFVPNDTEQCESWLLLPAENLWPVWIRGVLYLLAMIYLFVGIAIVSDVFMCSIEVITSKSKTVYKWDPERKENVKKEVLVWNETVANLTLMALGSSAPEILMAVIESIQNLENPPKTDSLGTFTIIGSAAFNLLVITAICILSVESPHTKKIKEFGVFGITSFWSIFAYLWVYFVVLINSRGEVTLAEAWITLGFFPLLVLSAYCQDNGWWCRVWWRFKKGRPLVGSDPSSNCNGNGSHMNVRVINGNLKRHSILRGPSPQLAVLEAEKTLSQQNLRTISEETAGDLVLRDLEGNHDESHSQEEKQQFARARSTYLRSRFRHAAVRSMLGGKKRLGFQKALGNGQSPRLMTLVDKVKSVDETTEVPFSEDLKGKFTFGSPHYSVLESAGNIELEVLYHRKDPKTGTNGTLENGKVAAYEVEEDGQDEEGIISSTVCVAYETRDGTAKRDAEYQYSQGTLIFQETEWKKTIAVPIVNNNQFNSNMEFYVILKASEDSSLLGDPSVSRVTIIDDDIPGEFSFDNSQYMIDRERGVVKATVVRTKGSDGTVTLQYATIDGTAKGGSVIQEGVDYKATSGMLCFKHEDTSQTLEIEINKQSQGNMNFVISLRNPSVGACLGECSAAVVSFEVDEMGDKLANILDDDDEEETWADQMRNAMTVGGDIDDFGRPVPASMLSHVMHFVAFFWKVLFALIPPKNIWGGWPAFCLSILFIGLLTAFVEQLGTLIGCVLGIEPAVAGITIIALGTSVPDTFASRTAAIQDQNADAAIGNITGSNSVNVFLGLGLPWVITTMYRVFTNNTNKFEVSEANLDLAIVLFASFGSGCLVILVLRRKFIGGELGGPKFIKIATGVLLVSVWFIWVTVCSLKAFGLFG